MAIPAVKPVTVISPETQISVEAMEQRVIKSREEHGDMLQEYHKAWYNSGHTWHYTHFLGAGTMKCPNDLWIYQVLMNDYMPTTVIETGTYQGASALWFAFLMDMLQIDGRVYTIDIDDHRKCSHPKIVFIDGDSTDPKIAEAIQEDMAARKPGPLLISLDADHSEAHVRKELDLYAPMTKLGDWLIVEDTNIAWVGEGGDRGARGGLESYLLEHPGKFRQDILCERYLLTMHPGGWLQRVAE